MNNIPLPLCSIFPLIFHFGLTSLRLVKQQQRAAKCHHRRSRSSKRDRKHLCPWEIHLFQVAKGVKSLRTNTASSCLYDYYMGGKGSYWADLVPRKLYLYALSVYNIFLHLFSHRSRVSRSEPVWSSLFRKIWAELCTPHANNWINTGEGNIATVWIGWAWWCVIDHPFSCRKTLKWKRRENFIFKQSTGFWANNDPIQCEHLAKIWKRFILNRGYQWNLHRGI